VEEEAKLSCILLFKDWLLTEVSRIGHCCYVETGFCDGTSLLPAVEFGVFDKIRGCEVRHSAYDIMVDRTLSFDNVFLSEKKSTDFLREVCKKEKLPCVFWLDAHFQRHYDPSLPSMGKDDYPLVEELSIIRERNKPDLVLFDDLIIIQSEDNPYKRQVGEDVIVRNVSMAMLNDAIGDKFVPDHCLAHIDTGVMVYRRKQ